MDDLEYFRSLYQAFNRRDIDTVLVMMSEEVDWPNAWQGGRLVGREAVRSYWSAQWAELDPHVEPLSVTERADGSLAVEVRQVVRTSSGELLGDDEVVHVYRLEDGVIRRMDVEEQTAHPFGDGARTGIVKGVGQYQGGGETLAVVTDLELVNFDHPSEVRTFKKGKFELYEVGPATLGRATYEPGWRWSEHVGTVTGETSCQVEHVGLVLSGQAVGKMDDGREAVMRAGDFFYVPPGHDSWVVGDEPYVSLHVLGSERYAAT